MQGIIYQLVRVTMLRCLLEEFNVVTRALSASSEPKEQIVCSDMLAEVARATDQFMSTDRTVTAIETWLANLPEWLGEDIEQDTRRLMGEIAG